jgi:hypothetical protein
MLTPHGRSFWGHCFIGLSLAPACTAPQKGDIESHTQHRFFICYHYMRSFHSSQPIFRKTSLFHGLAAVFHAPQRWFLSCCARFHRKGTRAVTCRRAAQSQQTGAAPAPVCLFLYSINIASPNEKNRYRSRTAVSYACSTCSRPARADTSIKRVLSGRWKFVISPSSILNR